MYRGGCFLGVEVVREGFTEADRYCARTWHTGGCFLCQVCTVDEGSVEIGPALWMALDVSSRELSSRYSSSELPHEVLETLNVWNSRFLGMPALSLFSVLDLQTGVVLCFSSNEHWESPVLFKYCLSQNQVHCTYVLKLVVVYLKKGGGENSCIFFTLDILRVVLAFYHSRFILDYGAYTCIWLRVSLTWELRVVIFNSSYMLEPLGVGALGKNP